MTERRRKANLRQIAGSRDDRAEERGGKSVYSLLRFRRANFDAHAIHQPRKLEKGVFQLNGLSGPKTIEKSRMEIRPPSLANPVGR